MSLRKIKSKKGNRQPKTEKQREAASKALTKLVLTNNPMHNPEIAKRNADARRGKIYNRPSAFKKGNKFGCLRKNTKISEERKIMHSMKMIGRGHPQSEETKRKISETKRRLNKIIKDMKGGLNE